MDGGMGRGFGFGGGGGGVVDGNLCRRWREGGSWRVWGGDGEEGVRGLLGGVVGGGGWL